MQQRVLHVLNGLGSGGIEKYILDLFQRLDPDKYVFDFLLRKKSNMHEQLISSLGGRVYYVSPYPQEKRQNYKDVDDFFSKHKEYNIVHIHMNSLEYVTILKLAKKHKINTIVLHSHNSSRVTHRSRITHYWNRFWTGNCPTDRLACSDKAACWMFGKKKYIFVSNGIDTERFRFRPDYRDEMRRELNLENQCVWGHIGRLCAIKNQKFIIDVFNKQASSNPNSVLLLIGEGNDRALLEEYVDNLCLKDRVQFLGVRDDVHKLLCAMDVMVFPSIAEGYPISVVEAQCSGLRCVLADTITKQVGITDRVEFLSLSDPLELWCESANAFFEETDRSIYADKIKAAGFDVCDTSKKIESFYDSKVKMNDNDYGENVTTYDVYDKIFKGLGDIDVED